MGKKGADLINRRDRNRIREVWSYSFSSNTLAALVDKSMLGGTVEEAAKIQLFRQFEKSRTGREAARLMTQGFLMGFLEEQSRMEEHLKDILAEDGDFFSLTEGLSMLKMLYQLQELYQVEAAPKLKEMIESCFYKIIQLLPSMSGVKEQQQQSCMESCLSLYQITKHKEFEYFRQPLLESFTRLLGKKDINPGLEGAALGLLYGDDSKYDKQIKEAAAGYLQGTENMQMDSGAFLRGLFYTARDYVFVCDDFIYMIDELLGKLSADAFMKLLPEFRQAFGYFTPLEINRLAEKAALLHGVKKKSLIGGRKVAPLEYEYGELLNEYALQRMEE